MFVFRSTRLLSPSKWMRRTMSLLLARAADKVQDIRVVHREVPLAVVVEEGHLAQVVGGGEEVGVEEEPVLELKEVEGLLGIESEIIVF